ncbi:hypothetical protein GCM10009827_095280 [Dactylosporangium maewongense]|uniref:Uncharacterized protein n=1 Tax=Dactylosporangium maewongense TaxID=634393 RepID=A0ABN2CIP7_9ACTN
MTTTTLTTQAPESRTLLVDLRTEYAALAACRTFNEYVRQRGAGLDGGVREVDLSRVVVVDRAVDLLAHSDALTVVRNAGAVRHVVCIAVGMADDASGVPVRLPTILRNEVTTVLWVGDEHGITWNPGEGPAPVVVLVPAGAGYNHLDDLLEALTAKELFDEVAARAAAMPSRVAVPGVRVVSNRVAGDVLVAAQRRAVEAIVTGGDRVIPAQPGGQDPVALGGELARRFGHPDPTQPTGEFGHARGDAERAARALGAALATAGRPWQPLLPQRGPGIPGLFRRSAETLHTYREALRRLLLTGDAGPDEQRRAKLRAEGVTLPPPPGGPATDQPAAVDQVLRTTLGGIGMGRPLRQLVTEIFETASALRPAGSAVRVPSVDQACPDQRLAELSSVPAMPGGFGSLLVPLLMVLAPLLALVPAAGSPLGRTVAAGLGGAVVALLVLGAALLRGRRNRIGLVRRAAVRDVAMVALVLVISAALPAVGAALLLSGGLGDDLGAGAGADPPVPAQVAWACAGAGVLLAVVATGLWWSRLVAAWRLRLPAGQPDRLVRALTDVYDEATVEWVLTDARTRASDAVRTLGSTLDSLGDELLAHGSALDAGPQGTPYTAATTVGAVNALVRHDLVTLTVDCVERGAADIRRGERDGVPDRVAQDARDLATGYDRYVRHDGIQHPPPRWPARGDRDQLVLTWWRGLDDFRRAALDDGPVQQLCADDQLQLIGKDPAGAVVVAFAPGSAKEAIADAVDGLDPGRRPRPAELVWTTAGTSAGMLHLVPLRARVEFEQLEATA